MTKATWTGAALTLFAALPKKAVRIVIGKSDTGKTALINFVLSPLSTIASPAKAHRPATAPPPSPGGTYRPRRTCHLDYYPVTKFWPDQSYEYRKQYMNSCSGATNSTVALVLLTLWILIQGFRILTGQSREPMMALVASMSRNALIVIAASTMALAGSDLHTFFTQNSGAIHSNAHIYSDY